MLRVTRGTNFAYELGLHSYLEDIINHGLRNGTLFIDTDLDRFLCLEETMFAQNEIDPVLQRIMYPRELRAPEPYSLGLSLGNMVSFGDFGFPWI